MRGRLARYCACVLVLAVAVSVTLGAIMGLTPWSNPPPTPLDTSAQRELEPYETSVISPHCRSLAEGLLRAQDLLDAVPPSTPRDIVPHAIVIWFRTDVPGVDIPSKERSAFSSKMSIILQNQYKDLIITSASIEVTVKFKGVWSRIAIPMKALLGVYDQTLGTRVDLRRCGRTG